MQPYLKGTRAWGASFREKLTEIGFLTTSNPEIKLGLINENEPSQSHSPIYLDITGAQEMTRTPIGRLAQLIQAPPGSLEAWERGESAPTMTQLANLFNQVVALGLGRFEEQDRYQRIIAQAKAEAAKELTAVPQKAVG